MTFLINTVIVMLFYYDSSSYFIHVQFVVVCVYVLLNHTFEYVIVTDCIGSYKSNYHTATIRNECRITLYIMWACGNEGQVYW
jgi:hypothetical protein